MRVKKFFIVFLFFFSITSAQSGLSDDEDNNLSVTIKSLKQDPVEIFPQEINFHIFSFLDPQSLGACSVVSKPWSLSSSTYQVDLGKRIFKNDYCSEYWQGEAAIQTVKSHFLKIIVNTLETPDEILDFIKKSSQITTAPQVLYTPFIYGLISLTSSSNPEVSSLWIAKCSEAALENKLKEMDIEQYYEFQNQNIFTAIGNIVRAFFSPYNLPSKTSYKTLNEFLIKRSNKDAIERAIENLNKRTNGYNENVSNYIEELLKTSEPGTSQYEVAMKMKIIGQWKGMYGYKKDKKVAKVALDMWAIQCSKKSIKTKIKLRLLNSLEKKTYIEDLLTTHNSNSEPYSTAIRMKFWGLYGGLYGYEKNQEDAKTLVAEWADKVGDNASDLMVLLADMGYKHTITSYTEAATTFFNKHRDNINGKTYEAFFEWKLQFKGVGAKTLIKKLISEDSTLALQHKQSKTSYQSARVHRLAHALKFCGLKHGVLGFKKNPEKANNYARRYYIGY